MNPEHIKQVLSNVSEGKISTSEAYDLLRDLPFSDLGHTKVDNHRALRTGYPEVIFCSGKSNEQVADIIASMLDKDNNILATRATKEMHETVLRVCPDAVFHESAKAIVVLRKKIEPRPLPIAVVTAGTSDIPVAEEAAITAELFGNRVERIFDVGIAGIHRLYHYLPTIRECRVVVAVAGMEGALPGVIGGLVDKPVIAVPTSVGYGANFNGLSALLTMLNSCVSGISVVNIDNGFGAGYLAGLINRT
jgi:pyridinium-3,5-biscarboxylic acid mononucleotide synthase